MNVYEEEIRHRLKAARVAKGMSQTDLAGYMGARGFDFKQQTINKIEKGERRVSAAELVALASSLGIEAANLLGNGESELPLAAAAGRLEESGRNLREAAISYARAMLAYAQTADGFDNLHSNTEHFIREGLLRQTPGYYATGDVVGSLEATMKLNRVELTGDYALELMAVLRAEHDLLHGDG